MIDFGPDLLIKKEEIRFTAIYAQGPGGQNVNKVYSAVLLKFNVINSRSLSDRVRQQLILKLGKKLSLAGDLIIKANRYRTQKQNKQDALHRLQVLLTKALIPTKKRKKTKPTASSIERRLAKKKLHSKNKSLRQSRSDHE